MDTKTFAKGVCSAFRASGFRQQGRLMVFTSSEVLAAISMQKSRTHQHMYINVGFWIRNLDPQGLSDFGRSEKVADAHLHFRLERVCPESREVIVAASALDEAEQEQWYPQLIDLIRDTAARPFATSRACRF